MYKFIFCNKERLQVLKMLNLLYLIVEWFLRIVPEQVIMIQLIVYRPMNDTQVQFLLRSNGHILKQQMKGVMVVSLFNIS